VQKEWQEYKGHLFSGGAEDDAWREKKERLLANLLCEMAKTLRYKIPAMDIFKGGYAPKGWAHSQGRVLEAFEYVHDLATVKKALPMWLYGTTQHQPAPTPTPTTNEAAPKPILRHHSHLYHRVNYILILSLEPERSHTPRLHRAARRVQSTTQRALRTSAHGVNETPRRGRAVSLALLPLQCDFHTLGGQRKVNSHVRRCPLDHYTTRIFHRSSTCSTRYRRTSRDGGIYSVDIGRLGQMINTSRSCILANAHLQDRQAAQFQGILFSLKNQIGVSPGISNACGNRSAPDQDLGAWYILCCR